MKWKKSIKMKNRLDEMQEQKMLKIEHNGYWMAFWGLFTALFVQQFVYGPGEWKYVAGEWIVFMCIALYMVFGCIKNGIWDRRLAPTNWVNMGASTIGGVFAGIFGFLTSYRQYHKLYGSIATGVIFFIMVVTACFSALTLSAFLYKRKRDKIENEEENELKDE
ncbi:MAG: hypothetical protein K2K21_11465 [Lachnospiraceae bacterium]|nr:hypothetical protein [Lachnospiraceae bacterium]